MDALERNYGKTTYYQVRNICWFLTIFTWLPLYVMTFAIEDSEARRIWIMIVNFFGIVNVLSSPISSYAMIYNGVRKRRTSNMNNSTALAQAKLESTIHCQDDWFDNSCSCIHNRLGCYSPETKTAISDFPSWFFGRNFTDKKRSEPCSPTTGFVEENALEITRSLSAPFFRLIETASPLITIKKRRNRW